MRVKFKRTEIHETLGRMHGPEYVEGRQYELPEDQANRWIQRGAAFEVEDPTGKPSEAEIVGGPAPVKKAGWRGPQQRQQAPAEGAARTGADDEGEGGGGSGKSEAQPTTTSNVTPPPPPGNRQQGGGQGNRGGR